MVCFVMWRVGEIGFNHVIFEISAAQKVLHEILSEKNSKQHDIFDLFLLFSQAKK